MKDIIPGKKTHLAAIGLVAVAVGGFFTGDLTALEAVTQVMAGFGLSALRLGVGK